MQRILNNFFLRNFCAWLLYLSPTLLQDIARIEQLGIPYVVKNTFGHTAFFMFFVFHSRVLYEKLFRRRRYLLYFVLFFVVIFCWRESSSYLIWLITRQPGETVYHIDDLENGNFLFFAFIYWADFVYSWIALGVYIAYRYMFEQTLRLQAESARRELELKQLNDQLNPHFLFNSLNNIYSHMLGNMGGEKELVLKLGELMRYVLDSSKNTVVPLTDELKFIEHYMSFEKERLGGRCTIHYHKDVRSDDFYIVPLIMFNFIENAFKHGTTSISRAEIVIDIVADEKKLSLYVENTVFRHSPVSTQIGLDNTQRRLALLYPGVYHLDTREQDGRYMVKLEIPNRK